jgi:hypothetical protein
MAWARIFNVFKIRELSENRHSEVISYRPWSPNRLLPAQSSSASHFTAGASGFFILIQWRVRPEM